MTLDRHDETPQEDAEHGVLSDDGAVDTAGIGILDGRTAQVNVTLPLGSEDDADDHADVVDDELPAAFVATGEIVVEDAPERDRTVGESASEAEDVRDAEEVRSDDALASDAAAPDGADERAEQVEPAAATAAAAAASAASAPPQAAQEPSAAPAPGALAVERIRLPQPETPLTSKRLGEFDAGRESSDLLTADRLLDRGQLSGPEPEGLWQHLLYSLSRHRINLGDSRRARARKELDRRIAAPLPGGARFVPVLSRKGGVGKTTVTTLLGMALAHARDDRVIAVDANPDRGTLADRIGRPAGRTVRDLARTRGDVSGYSDISAMVARDQTRLDVLASDGDPRVSEAFSDRDYDDVAALAAHYYSIVLTDTGTGIVHSVMGATLERADELVIVAGLSVDEARLASETLTWLETNGYADHVRGAVVVLNNSRPGAPLVREAELEAHFRTRVRAVVRMPYDRTIGTGSVIAFDELQPATRAAARELAATVVEGLRSLVPAA